jgi:ATP-binding cassette subfamily B protein
MTAPPAASPTPRADARIAPMGRAWRHFGPLVLRHWAPLAWALASAAITTVLTVLQPFPVKLLFDYIIVPGPAARWNRLREAATAEPLATAGWLCAALVAITALRAVTQSWQILGIARAGQRILSEIRLRLYDHLQSLSASYHDESRTGDLLVRLTGDIAMMRELLVASAVDGTHQWLTLAAMAAVMAWYDVPLTLAALAVLPALGLLSLVYSRRIGRAARKQRRVEADLASATQEALIGMRDIQAFTRERHERRRFEEQSRGSLKAGLKSARLEAELNRRVQIVVALGMALVFFLGVRRLLAGDLSAGTLLLFQAYVTGMYRPIRRLAFFTHRTSRALACAERIIDVLEQRPAVADAPGALDLGAALGRVEFQDVEFSYRPGKPALRRVSFAAGPDEVVALVGPSGAGKTTVLNLLLRFYDPECGRVLLDDRDLRGIRLTSLRRQISVVPQNPVLFRLSVHDNIAFSRPDASRDRVRQAAERAGALEFIERLPQGFDTRLGERGVTLSGGQRQRLAIARAFLKRAPVLVLDEPAAGLDAESEREIRRALRRLARGRTAFVIDHRMSMVSWAARILFLDQGRIVEQGSHAELLALGGRYARFYAEQRGEVPAADAEEPA